MSTLDLLIVIPARGGSQRLPGKNLYVLAGRTLLEWTEHAIVESGIDAPRLLTTDSESIAEAGRDLGWLTPFTRPAHLATSEATTLMTVLHALDRFAEDRSGYPELTMVLQVTSPLRGGACIRDSVALLAEDSNTDAVVAMRDLHRTTSTVFLEGEDGFASPVADRVAGSRQTGSGQGDRILTPNGALYLVRTAALREHITFFPARTRPLVMDDVSSVDIDTETDMRLAETIIATGKGQPDHAD